MVRVATALAILALLWVVIHETSPPVFTALAAMIAAVSAWEAYGLMGRFRPMRAAGTAAAVAVAVSFASDHPLAVPAVLGAATLAIPCAAMARRDDPAAMLESMLGTLFPVLLVGLGLGHAVALRGLPGEDGRDLVLLLLVIVAAADSAALYAGRAFGRRRLAPTISPKKSWEGAAGGLAGGIAAAFIAKAWFFHALPAVHALGAGVLVTVTGILGDLAESVMKRAGGAKDSSALLPGHGGLLDRSDSLLFAAPVLYYYGRAFLEGLR